MSTSTINKSIFLAASREVVWDYLTDKDKLAQWFHPAAENLVEGKSYALLKDRADADSKLCWGEVLSARRPSFLKYTFTVKPMAGEMTTVSWTLEEAPGGTRLTLMHEGVVRAGGDAAIGLLLALDKGWDEHFAKLRGLAVT